MQKMETAAIVGSVRKQLDYWMSQGVSDPLERATTITIYTDVASINAKLKVLDTGQA